MFKRNALITIALAVAISLSSAPFVQAATYVTTLSLATPLYDDNIDTVVFNWSTNKASGSVGSSDLLDLSMELRSGGDNIYTDTIMVGGVVQSIGGVSRTVPFWDFDLDTLVLWQMATGEPQPPVDPGTYYIVFDSESLPADGIVVIGNWTEWTWPISLLEGWDAITDPFAGQETVLDPLQTVMDLADKILQLNVKNGISNSLDAKLNAVLNTIDDINTNNDAAAINSLEAFINAINTQLSNGKIPSTDQWLADVLINDAQAIIDYLSP